MLPLKNREDEAQRPLNQRLEIWHPKLSTEQDELGADIDKPGFVMKVWGNVTAVRGVEKTENGKTIPYLYYKIIVRYTTKIEETMVIKYRGKELNINTKINLQERNQYLELNCTERVKPLG